MPAQAVNPLDSYAKHFESLCHAQSSLSPISGSIDLESPGDSPLTVAGDDFDAGDLPLTETNLALFTSDLMSSSSHSCKTSSTNELPLSDLKFRSRLARQATDDTSLEANWDTDVKQADCKIHQRSLSDPNIMENEWISSSDKSFLLQKYRESLNRAAEATPNRLAPNDTCRLHAPPCPLCVPRPATHLLAFLSSRRSLSHHPANPYVMSPCVSYSECGQATKRHRHSISGQMSYFKVMGLSYGMPGLKKMVAGSTNSLFSTAVISGSSSAPNLRDMIPSTASGSGKRHLPLVSFRHSDGNITLASACASMCSLTHARKPKGYCADSSTFNINYNAFSYRRVWRRASDSTVGDSA